MGRSGKFVVLLLILGLLWLGEAHLSEEKAIGTDISEEGMGPLKAGELREE